MKSFLGGLTLAIVMALFNGAATPPPSICVLLPRIDAGMAIATDELSCRVACDRAVRTPARLLK